MVKLRLCILGAGRPQEWCGVPPQDPRLRRLTSFSIVPVPWFPFGINKQTQVFKKEVQVWASLFRKHTLKGRWHARLPRPWRALWLGVWKVASWLWALQHRAALCLSSRGQRIRGMNACHRPRMPCAVYQPPIAPWCPLGRHKCFPRLTAPSRGCQGPQQMCGEHSAEEGGFSSL